MTSYREEALEFKLLLEAGLVDAPEVIEWADKTLLNCGDYDDDLANICLAENATPKKLIPLLNKLASGLEEWDAMRRVLGRMYDDLHRNPDNARVFAQFLERFCVRHGYNLPDDMGFIYGIEDYVLLAEQGVLGTTEQVVKTFLDDLSCYKDKTE